MKPTKRLLHKSWLPTVSEMSQLSEIHPDYSWAEYLHCMEGGSDVLTLPQAKASSAKIDKPLAGFALAIVITVSAVFLSELPVWPFTLAGGRHPIEPVMLAIVLGMILSNLISLPKILNAGIKFSVKKILPIGIVLLGARLNFQEVGRVGLAGMFLSLLEIVVALTLLLFLAKKMGLPRKLGVLLAIGTAICGGTAIVATAPVIEAEEKDVVFSVATVTLLGLIAMFLLPVIGHAMDLSQKAFGIWAGLSIHQTPQVIAAGFAYGPEAGATATIAKLARVCLLAPIVFLAGVMHARTLAQNDKSKKQINYWSLFPMFIFGFLAMALLRSLGWLPEMTFNKPAFFPSNGAPVSLASVCDTFSKYCIVISMAGVGLETRFSAMRQTGWKPFIASFIAVLVIATGILGLIKLIGF
jgi:uncharacterized integral membrane protein (TIGR00698 family)